MFTKFPRNLFEGSEECYHFNIPANIPEDSEECSRRFRGMLKKISGNVQKDSRDFRQDFGKCLRRFQRIFKKIPRNINKDSGECLGRF